MQHVIRYASDYDHLHLAAKVMEHTTEGIMITDETAKIIAVNPAFTNVTGYTKEEVVGQTPRMLHSGKQGPEFYNQMWRTIHQDGSWSGEIWNKRKNGDVFPEWLTINRVEDKCGKATHYIGIFRDITRYKEREAQLQKQAYYDWLTNIPNRRYFQQQATERLQQAAHTAELVAFLFIDLDRFKEINDEYGHETGDTILHTIAQRLQNSLRKNDMIGRWGGDEFTLLIPGLTKTEQLTSMVKRLQQHVSKPIQIGNHTFHITLSIGISMFPTDGSNLDELLNKADTSMYVAKHDANTYRYFVKEMTDSSVRKSSYLNRLHRAIQDEQFIVHYQPQFDLQNGGIIGSEALVRWQDTENGLIYPGEFIPTAERTGLINIIGSQVLRHICRDIRRWLQAGHAVHPVSMNVSLQQLQSNDFITEFKHVLREYQVPPELITIEITESMMLQHEAHVIQTINDIKALGSPVALDDFGTGYSSLSHLDKLPIDILKIDRSFISNKIPRDVTTSPILKSVIDLGRNMNLVIIAEGIKSSRQMQVLRDHGCHAGQGFLFSPPISGKGLESQWLRSS